MVPNPGLLSGFLQHRRILAARAELRGCVLDIGAGDGALAEMFSPTEYVGVEIEPLALELARHSAPDYEFFPELPPGRSFDTVVALAVIEHVDNPSAELAKWISPLRVGGRLVLTTPHRSFRWVHELAARLGLASRSAAEDHKELFDRQALVDAVKGLPLRLVFYRRFLLGMNQLFVFERL